MKTNKDYIIAALTGEIDDGGAALESVVHYNLKCPHRIGDGKCLGNKELPSRELCFQCKMEWLESEYGE